MIDFHKLSKIWEEQQKFRKEKEIKLHNDMVDFFNEIRNK